MLAFSWLSGAGNDGAYRLNASATRFFHVSDWSQVNATFGVSDPTTTIVNNRNLDLVEDNGWPNIETRLALAVGPLDGEGF